MLFYVDSMADYASLIWAKNHIKYQIIRDEPLYPYVLWIPSDKYRTAPIFSPVRAYGEGKPWLLRSTQRLPVSSPNPCSMARTRLFASKSLTLNLIRPTFERSTCISDNRSRQSHKQWLKACLHLLLIITTETPNRMQISISEVNLTSIMFVSAY